MRWSLLCVGLVMLAVAMCALGALAAEDQVYFRSPMGDPIDTILVGQEQANLMVRWGQNASDWEVVLDHPLFRTQLVGVSIDQRVEAGHGGSHGLEMNVSCPPGDYIVPVGLNYITDDGSHVHRDYNLTVHYIRSIELRRFAIEQGGTSRLVVEVELFLPCDGLTVEFDTDGNLEVETEYIERGALGPGVYRFETDLKRTGFFMSGDDYEVGYDIRATFDDRTIQLTEKNIDPRTVTRGDSPFAWVLLAFVLVVVAVVGLVLVLRMRRRKPKAWATGAPAPHLTGRS